MTPSIEPPHAALRHMMNASNTNASRSRDRAARAIEVLATRGVAHVRSDRRASSRTRAMIPVALVQLMFVCIVLVSAVGAVERRQSASAALGELRMQIGPYCGIYSLVGAASALGQEISISELTSSHFVGSELGSSATELVEAARTCGLRADFATRLTDWELQASKSPLILRISTAERRDVFNHWVAYLGVEDGKARVLDYPDPIMLYPFGELLSRWDGSAVVVSLGPESSKKLLQQSRTRGFISFLAVLLTVSLLAKYACRLGRGSRARSSAGALAMGAASVVFGLCHDLARPGSLLKNARVAEVVAVADGAAALPVLTARELREALDADAEALPVLVDARLPRDYKRGHIPGAINIPAWATASWRQEAISAIPRSAHVVVYCQGPECSYDEDVAAQFVGAEFERISLMPGGWAEWRTVATPPRSSNGG